MRTEPCQEATSCRCKPRPSRTGPKDIGEYLAANGIPKITADTAERARYKEALSIYRDIKNRRGEANCLSGLGDVHQMLGEYEAARAQYEAALDIYRDIKARLGEAHCLRSLGDVHRLLTEYEAAREQYMVALDIYRDIENLRGEANCLRGLGDVHLALNEYKAAREHYEAAITMYDELGDLHGAANTVGYLSWLLAAIGQRDDALRLGEKCVARYKTLDQPALLASGYYFLASIYDELKEYRKAAEVFGMAAELSPSEATYYLNQANSYLKAAMLGEAEAALRRAHDLQPSDPYLPLRWAQWHVLKGEGEAALAQTDEAFRRPDAPTEDVWLVRSMALLLLQRVDEALAAIDECIARTTDSHDYDGYIEAIERFKKLNPEVDGIEEVVSRLDAAWKAGEAGG